MGTIHFATAAGATMSVENAPGQSLMQLATSHMVPGIEASCGGYCSCATCHVYVAADWAERLPPVSEDESDLLEGTASPRLPTSRLSCQITLSPALDGLSVTIPDRQS